MADNCEWCGTELTDEEIRYPDPDGPPGVCDHCIYEEYRFDCCRCGKSEHVDHQHVFCAVFEKTRGLGDDLLPGIYEIVAFPYYADGMIEGHVFEESFRRVADIDFESAYDYPMGHLCRACRKAMKLRQSKRGKKLHEKKIGAP